MLTTEEWMDIKDLHRQGHSIREIARRTGHARNTVRAIIKERVPAAYQRQSPPSKLDPFKPYLDERYKNCSLSAVRLYAEIGPMGYAGSVDLVRRYLSTLAPQKRAMEQLTVRFETPPGQQGQADWAYCGRFSDQNGKEIPVYAFVIVLSFSRTLYVQFVSDMSLSTLMRCHQCAFAFFGGLPKSVLYDNMKQVKIGPQSWNRLFMDFAGHYGFTPMTHRIRRPRTKGKVERMVAYVRDSFLKGRSFADFDDLNAQALHWLEHVANVRIHATTGKRPVDLLPEEKLTPLAAIQPFVIPDLLTRTADRESFVSVDGSRYSVPPSHAGQKLLVMRRPQSLLIVAGEQVITEHPRAQGPGECFVKPEHMQEVWKLSLPNATKPKDAIEWNITFEESVQARPLSRYEDAIACESIACESIDCESIACESIACEEVLA
jgi:transposase